MIRKGNNIIVKPKPREKVTASGVILPDTATLPNQEHGVIVEGYGEFEVGMNVLYHGARAFEEGDLKVISKDKIILWDYDSK